MRVEACCAGVLRLLILQLGHQFVSLPDHAVAVAVAVILWGQYAPLKSHAAVCGRVQQECRKGATAAPRSFAKVEYRPTYISGDATADDPCFFLCV